MGRRPAGAAADVEVGFIDADGAPRRELLSGCWNVAFKRAAPVRGFASFRAQPNRPGLRGGTWIPGQRQRLRQLAPGTWDQALAGVPGAGPGWQDDGPGYSVVEIAIYPDVVWLAARSLRAHSGQAEEGL
jgi:hypothetical protein